LNDRARKNSELESVDDPLARNPDHRASGVQTRAQPSPPSAAPVAAPPLPLISIGSPADPALLEPTYAYLSAYTSAYLPRRVADRLNVAIYELYANALRYGSGSGEVRLQLERSPSGVGARLRIANHAEPAQLVKLLAHVSRVLEDPSAAFIGEMNRFAGGSYPLPMLGLVRVAHESGLLLELVRDGDRVEVTTVCEP
jgi:hypothetical protein